MSKFKLLFCIFLLLLTSGFVYIPQKAYASNIIFQENFDSENINDWTIGSNNCLYDGSPAVWTVNNGKLGMKINGGTCYSDISPSDTRWNYTQSDYMVDFDMTLVSGTDHHFAFRYTNSDSWYNFHIQSPSNIIFQRMSEAVNGN